MAADSVFDGGGEVAGEQRSLAGLAGESGAAPADVAGEERSRYGLAGEIGESGRAGAGEDASSGNGGANPVGFGEERSGCVVVGEEGPLHRLAGKIGGCF